MRDVLNDYYEILGVTPDASVDSIRERLELLRLAWHPDKFHRAGDSHRIKAQEEFKQAEEAAHVLLDPLKRAEFDQHRRRKQSVPPAPQLSATELDFGVLTQGETKTRRLTIQNTGGQARTANVLLDNSAPWVQLQIAHAPPEDGFCPITITITASTQSLSPDQEYDDWLKIDLDGVTAKARLHIRTAEITASSSPPPHVPPPPRPPASSTVAPRPASDSILATLVVAAIAILFITVLAIIHTARQETPSVPVTRAVDPWPDYRNRIVGDINERPNFDSRSEIQTILREVSRQQMSSPYVTDANRAFLDPLFRKLGPCNVLSNWHCPAYPVAEHAQLLDDATIVVDGTIRLFPYYVQTPPNPHFKILFRRERDHWRLLPPADFVLMTSRPVQVEAILLDRTAADIQTSAGSITIRFFPQLAPRHVENFVQLAQSGVYAGTRFHRVIPGLVIQGGDQNAIAGDTSGWDLRGSGRTLPAEFSTIAHRRGILSMARAQDPNGASSQFFICVGDASFLDGDYTILGEVISGIEVVDVIANAPRSTNDRALQPVTIEDIRVYELPAAQDVTTNATAEESVASRAIQQLTEHDENNASVEPDETRSIAQTLQEPIPRLAEIGEREPSNIATERPDEVDGTEAATDWNVVGREYLLAGNTAEALLAWRRGRALGHTIAMRMCRERRLHRCEDGQFDVNKTHFVFWKRGEQRFVFPVHDTSIQTEEHLVPGGGIGQRVILKHAGRTERLFYMPLGIPGCTHERYYTCTNHALSIQKDAATFLMNVIVE